MQNTNLETTKRAQCPLQALPSMGLLPSVETPRQTLTGLLLGTVCLVCLSPMSRLSPAGLLLICGGCSLRSRQVSWAWWPPKLLPSFPVNCSGISSCSLVLFTDRVKFEKGIPTFIRSFNPRILKHQPQNTGQLPIGCKSGLLCSKLENEMGRGELKGSRSCFHILSQKQFLQLVARI